MKLNQLLNLIILAACIALCLWWGFGQRAKRMTAESNYATSAIYHDQQVTLTKKQAKEFYGGVLNILGDKLGIKPKQITTYIKGDMRYQDTGSVKVIAGKNDTILVYPDSLTGLIQKPCYDLQLLLYKGHFFEQLNYHDSLSVALYRERQHRFLFIRYGRWVNRAAIYSSCRDTTLQIVDHVKINR